METPSVMKNRSKYHPDVPLFLSIIPFINAINYYLTYTNIQLNWFLLITFSIDTVQGYLAWMTVRRLIIYLDGHIPYQGNPGRRIMIQLISTTFLGLLVISLLTELVSWIGRGQPADAHFYYRDLFIIGIWFFVINGIYVGLHYYREWQTVEAQRHEEKRLRSEGFVVKQGKLDVRLNFEDLSGCYLEEGYVMACTIDGKKYILDQSLEKIEKILPETFFFRLNRQFIVHRQTIGGFERAENGKINVLVRGDHAFFPARIPVSRTKAPAFKHWFGS